MSAAANDDARASVDPVLAAAVDVARAAVLDGTEATAVGEHREVRAAGPLLATHVFACLLPGYRGWYWAADVTRAPDSEQVTVNDVVLLPGDEAIVAPAWKPYKDRIRPGDLGPGDLLPPEEDDVRLVPSWTAGDGEEQTPDRYFAREVGLGRRVVLSLEGRVQAADRWYAGEQGPDVPLAQQAPGVCGGCGFLVSLAGPLSSSFGVCANGQANDDGRVVALSHGCGAHSGATVRRSTSAQALPDPVLDTTTPDVVELD
ncbi:DUF3027 domain-containing protein [Aeromicrobium sp. IC_218]|uniref:DUF3027 domain-containing protein n=1 Tax=Aeromicrobium sp. IC_218 TaxID=2545468 RepID=UPI00103B57E8|nr:DUF3027 domain-containing protein [Aeromicrobium sp. IC_218]TCI99018.1 DUF3027 domain-containing protein [Aeromicrobium sp. IC_218]